MTKYGKGLAGAAALLALTTTSAQATSACWNGTEQAAAKVRNLQSRLMDSTLRCQIMGFDITPAYNGFVQQNRATIQGANGVLRARLGEREYDRFVTWLANVADGGQTNGEHCAAAAASAQAGIAAAGDVEKLLALEAQVGPAPELPGGSCPVTFAVAAATASATADVLQH
jgi:hypothetical protein